MGHIHLRKFPGTPNWQRVARYIVEGAQAPEVAAATLAAALNGFKQAQNDPTIAQAIFLLTQLAEASRKSDPSEFIQHLSQFGIHVTDTDSVYGLTSAYLEALDKYNRNLSKRSDIGEMGQMAATESLTALLSKKGTGLFGGSPEAIQTAIRELTTDQGFGVFNREFTGRFLRQYINYFLSLELSNHVGGNRRFANIQEHIDFKKSLEQHCHRVAAIVEDYAAGWYAKKKREGVQITPKLTRNFWSYGLHKVHEYMGGGDGVQSK